MKWRFLKSFAICLLFFPWAMAQQITSFQYGIDTDPGPGNGITISADPNTGNLSQTFEIPTTGLSQGFHTFFFRAKNDNNTWSLYSHATYYLYEITNTEHELSTIEYWFDQDPGPGNGTSLSAMQSTYSLPIDGLDLGFHKFGIRAQNSDGTWGLLDHGYFYIFSADENTPAELTQAIFLFDEPIQTTGTAPRPPGPLAPSDPFSDVPFSAPVTPTGNPNEYIIEIPTDIINCGDHELYLSLVNDRGNQAIYQLMPDISVIDSTSPTIVLMNEVIAALDASGEAIITVDDVDNGSFDDCELTSLTLNQSSLTYSCDDIGTSPMATITAMDGVGNEVSQNFMITVVDNISPTIIGQDITLDLGTNTSVSLTPQEVDNGSFDNCSLSLSLSQDVFDEVGEYTVTLTGEDSFGNESSTTVTVTVIDSVLSVMDQEFLNQEINVSPNPVKEILYISGDFEYTIISIFDASGKLIEEHYGEKESLDLTNLETGTYILHFSGKGATLIKRIIKK